MPTPSGLVTKQELIDGQLDTAHLGRVANSKDASGNPISTSTNRTGGVNKTLDALETEYLEAIRAAGGVPLGRWTAGVTTFNAYNEYAVFNGIPYKPRTTTTFPYVAQGADPTVAPDDANVQPYTDVTQEYVTSSHGEYDGYTAANVADAKIGKMNGGATVDLTQVAEGTKVEWMGYYSRSDGGSNWGRVRFGPHTETGGRIFSINANTYIEANLKGRVSVKKYGAVGDNVSDDTPAFHAIFEDADTYDFSISIPQSVQKYRLTSPIQLKTQHDIKGSGFSTVVGGLNFVGCNGFEILNSASRTKIVGVSFFQDVRYSDTVNSYVAIKYEGNLPAKSEYHTVRDCFFDGWGVLVECKDTWQLTLDNLHSVFCGSGIHALGSSVNNRLVNSNISGTTGSTNTYGLLIGDGTTGTEGWIVSNNVIAQFEIGVLGRNSYHIYIQNNIFDFMGVSAVRLQGFSVNYHVINNYMASDVGTEMIDINTSGTAVLANVSGSKIVNNIMLGYTSLNYGVRVRGDAKDTLIDGNSIKASVADIYIEEPLNNHKVTNNNMRGAGCTVSGTTPRVLYEGNNGAFNSTFTTQYKTHYKNNKQTYDIRNPTSGVFNAGDIIWNVSPGAVENTAGWICITSGTVGAGAVIRSFGDYTP